MSTDKKLTPEILKTFKGLEKLTEEQAQELTDQLNALAQILIKGEPIKKKQNNETDHA
jgi:hypothetical protein